MIQIILDLMLGRGGSVIMAAFMPSSDDYMGLIPAFSILLIDYFIAYTVLGIGGIFRKRIKNKTMALVLGCILALGLRYVAHIVSGYIFYGAWAEWFFTQEGFYSIGGVIMDTFSGKTLALIYSVFYNGLYMIPEIIITSVAAVIVSVVPEIKLSDVNAKSK
jgi:thiamine transporter